MTNLPSGGNWPYLDLPSLEALKADHERLRYMTDHELARMRHYLNELNDTGNVYVARVTLTILNTSVQDPSNPTPSFGSAVILTFDSDLHFVGDGREVTVWTVGPTAPAGTLIYIHEDQQGNFWYLGGNNTAVATTQAIIPGRTDDVPGGPVDVTIRNSVGSAFVDGLTVPVYSWVKTDSADPANEPGGVLYIYIAQDANGTWWFIAQDCTKPPIQQQSYYLQANQVVTTTLSPINDTQFTLPTFEGFYTYTLEAEISVTGIPGNQSWDVDIGLYDETNTQWIRAWDWAGSGDVPFNPRISVTWAAEITSALAGVQVQMYCVRSTTTGTVTLIGSATEQLTGHELTGPY